MSTWEAQLNSRIIRTGCLTDVIEWGITVEDFTESAQRGFYDRVLEVYQNQETSGSVLGPSSIRQLAPNFAIVDDANMTTNALCQKVRETRLQKRVREVLREVEQTVDTNLEQAVKLLQGGMSDVTRLSTSRKTDVRGIDAMNRILSSYQRKLNGEITSICPYPWLPLQKATGGIEIDDFLVFYGRPKSMKSWVLAYLIAWAYEQGKRVMIYTKEMTADNIFQRVAACQACIRYHEFRQAELSPYEFEAITSIRDMWRAWQDVQPIICLSGKDAQGGDTVPWLRSKIELHRPDLCFIDGMYLMSDHRGGPKQKDHARVQNISRDLRQCILDTGVPIAATIQANREADKNEDANLSEIAFSDAIGQDATLATRVINEKNKPTLSLLIGGSREFKLDGFRIYGIPATNFGFAGYLDESEILRVNAQDAEDAEREATKTKKSSKRKPATTAKPDDVEDEELKAAAEARQKLRRSIQETTESVHR